jgi:hypothetical protein
MSIDEENISAEQFAKQTSTSFNDKKTLNKTGIEEITLTKAIYDNLKLMSYSIVIN